ncbi:hypothetical protein ES703_78962 [subsurface metagenome]
MGKATPLENPPDMTFTLSTPINFRAASIPGAGRVSVSSMINSTRLPNTPPAALISSCANLNPVIRSSDITACVPVMGHKIPTLKVSAAVAEPTPISKTAKMAIITVYTYLLILLPPFF